MFERCVVEQHVVERAGQSREAVRRRVDLESLLGVGVARLVQHLQRVFLPVRVEVTDEGDGRDIPLDRRDPVAQGGGLTNARFGRRSLTIAGVGIARPRTRRALRLEVVHDEQERRTAGIRREDLTDRLAGVPEGFAVRALVAEGPRRTDGVDGCRAIDDRVRDDVLFRDGREVTRGGHEGPGLCAVRGVERVHERRRRLICLLTERGRVLDLHEADDVRVQRRDRRDELVLLALEIGGIPRTTLVASVADGDTVAEAVGVRRAPRVVGPESREVVQDVERCHAHIATDGLGGSGPGIREGHTVDAGAVAGERLRRVQLPRGVAIVDDQRLGEAHATAHDDRLRERDIGRGQRGIRR